MLTAPVADVLETTRIGAYVAWLAENRGLSFPDYRALWQWSVDDLDGFWSSIWDFVGVRAHRPYDAVLRNRVMPGAEWFPGALLNYAEHSLGLPEDADSVAVVAHSQTRQPITLTFGHLTEQVTQASSALRRLGVGRGDRVVAYLPNIPETLVAFLATASLGAVWSSCAPEFGASSIVERFGQVQPKVLLAVPGYVYGDKPISRVTEVAEVRAGLPTLEHVIGVSYGDGQVEDALNWSELLAAEDPSTPLEFEPVPFNHPLYVLFSSGTTGKPKAIVHGHGGMLLEQSKTLLLHYDLGPGDRMLWFSTTAWMMWNVLVATLLTRASIVMIDGNPTYPDVRNQWRLAEQTQPTLMGVSPGYLMASRREGVQPTREFDLSSVRQLGAAGRPLPVEGFEWVHEQFGDHVLLNVGSGGTDVATGIVQGNPWLPVWSGEMSGPSLGVAAAAFDPDGTQVVGELGELVIRQPMPSMPVGFWGDDDGSLYRSAYFDTYPGVWRHGDWIRFNDNGSCVITGRSDATLNRGGVRIGTAEFYRVLDELDEVADSLVIHLEDRHGGNGELILFVVPSAGLTLDHDLRATIRHTLRTSLSPRHVPDLIEGVHAIPHTRTGKKLEVPIKRIFQGAGAADVVKVDALADASALDDYIDLARDRRAAERTA
ncbi:MAG: acetoacetate--CoA ligase [Actinophytocola sp.]|nr:acetoacetate--CoA ligase [Actinophytocola sp.]